MAQYGDTNPADPLRVKSERSAATVPVELPSGSSIPCSASQCLFWYLSVRKWSAIIVIVKCVPVRHHDHWDGQWGCFVNIIISVCWWLCNILQFLEDGHNRTAYSDRPQSSVALGSSEQLYLLRNTCLVCTLHSTEGFMSPSAPALFLSNRALFLNNRALSFSPAVKFLRLLESNRSWAPDQR
jgi:hypothetical protein